MSRLMAAVRTAAAVTVVALYVLLAGPVVLVWALGTGRPDALYRAGAGGIRAGFWLAGIRVRVLGAEQLVGGGAVYASNHASNLDPPAVFMALRPVFPRLKVLYKAELRKLPLLVWAFDLAGFVPLERENQAQSWPAVDRAATALASGDSFLIFPEGTRSRTGELLPFKKGGFVMALKAHAPIVPVVVTGGEAAMRKGSPLIWPATITVRIFPLQPTAGLGFDDRDAVAERTRAAIAGGLRVIPAG